MPLPRPEPGTGRWWVIGIGGCLIASVLLGWLAVANTLHRVTWTVTAYEVQDAAAVMVSFDVHRDPGTAAICHVEALDARFGVVGQLDVPVAATAERSTAITVTVRTTAKAVTGTVKSCERAPAR